MSDREKCWIGHRGKGRMGNICRMGEEVCERKNANSKNIFKFCERKNANSKNILKFCERKNAHTKNILNFVNAKADSNLLMPFLRNVGLSSFCWLLFGCLELLRVQDQ